MRGELPRYRTGDGPVAGLEERRSITTRYRASHGWVHWGGVSVGGGNAGVHLRKVDKVTSSFIGHFKEELLPITDGRLSWAYLPNVVQGTTTWIWASLHINNPSCELPMTIPEGQIWFFAVASRSF